MRAARARRLRDPVRRPFPDLLTPEHDCTAKLDPSSEKIVHNPRRAAALALVHGPRQAPRAAHNYGEHPLGTPRRVQDFCHVCLIFAPAPTAHKCWCSGFGRCMHHADGAKIGRRACDLPPVLPDPLRPRATISRSPPSFPALCSAADAGERVSKAKLYDPTSYGARC